MILRVNERSTIRLLTINGYATVTRRVLRPIKEHNDLFFKLIGKRQIIPLDTYLGIDKYSFKITPQMMLRIAKEGITDRSYEKIQERFRQSYNIDIDSDTIREVINFVAKIYVEYENKCNESALAIIPELKRVPNSVKFTRDEAGIVFASVDGSYSPIIKKDGIDWKDTKLGLLYNLLDCSFQGDRAKFIKDYTICIGSKEEFIPYLANLLVGNHVHYYQEVTTVADGAPWIEQLFHEMIPTHVGILDLYHFRERIGNYFKQECKDESIAQRWIAVSIGLVDRGQWKKLRDLKIVSKNKGKKTTGGYVNLYKYIDNHSSNLDYPAYALKQYMAVSSHTESGNKSVVQDRVKGNGKRWNKETVQGILSLRSRSECNRWNEVEKVFLSFYFDNKI